MQLTFSLYKNGVYEPYTTLYCKSRGSQIISMTTYNKINGDETKMLLGISTQQRKCRLLTSMMHCFEVGTLCTHVGDKFTLTIKINDLVQTFDFPGKYHHMTHEQKQNILKTLNDFLMALHKDTNKAQEIATKIATVIAI